MSSLSESVSRNHCRWARTFASAYLASLAFGCTSEPPPPKQYADVSELHDSKECARCHEKHYDEWSASMHAYAAEDPVFLAMNQRGQEETGGALGTLCVNCHAPLAVRLGYTDGTNLDAVPPELRGVTCYFCHNVESVDGTHNNPLALGDDVTMRGRIRDPKENDFHRSAYSTFLAGDQADSAAMCGSCHDIVLPVPPAPPAPEPVALERTYTEWLSSVFSPAHAPAASAIATCNACHLPAIESGRPISTTGPNRTRHGHHMAGVDGPMTPFPATTNATRDAELATEQALKRQQLLDPTVRVEICVQALDPGAAIHLTLDNANAGHNYPSGAAQDRRAWLEVIAYDGDEIIYQSGVFADGEVVSTEADPDLWLLRDQTFDENGEETHMFWDVASIKEKTLPVQVTTNPADENYYKSHLRRRFPFAMADTIAAVPTRVTVRLRIMPVGLEVLDDLIESGHLDARFRSEMATLDLLPFRNDSFSPASGLGGLNSVTMEWSAATKASRLFVAREDFTQSPPFDCVAMPLRPR